jgi:hypothetical protein
MEYSFDESYQSSQSSFSIQVNKSKLKDNLIFDFNVLNWQEQYSWNIFIYRKYRVFSYEDGK